MVRVISLEQALAQGETQGSIGELISWHQAMLDRVERANARQAKQLSTAKHHKAVLSELRNLSRQLAAHVGAAAA